MRIAWIILLTCVSATAQTNTVSFAANGLAFTNARVVKVEPDGITVVDGTRGGKFAFDALPREIRERFNYEPTAATLYRNEAGLRATTQKARWMQDATAARLYRERTNRIAQTVMGISGRVWSKFDGGLIVKSGEHSMDAAREHWIKTGFGGTTVPYMRGGQVVMHIGFGAVTDVPPEKLKGVADGERIELIVYPNGLYEVGGRTYRAFTCRPELVTEIADEETLRVLRAPKRINDSDLFTLGPGGNKACTGRMDCAVCTNCKRCEYCRKGGKCGACSK